ncbi:uncharacterized protein METZ01_LOCUS2670 [marine metagenome]|uniref:Uncharacterized protein n=1 Tax=marine metagenome TaxID=408172 RepID=A0A381N5D2_9ZZZZ
MRERRLLQATTKTMWLARERCDLSATSVLDARNSALRQPV